MNAIMAGRTVGTWALGVVATASAQPCEPGWHTVGGGTSHEVQTLALYEEHGHKMLFAGGGFGWAGGLFTGTVARWDGFSWSAVGNVIFDQRVFAMHVHDDGSGPSLYIGGTIRPVPGFEGRGVARWDGVTWSRVGAGLTPYDYGPLCFAVFDDGNGPSLYAGGVFTVPGYTGATQRHLARWNGTTWIPFGDPHQSSLEAPGIMGMTVFDDGQGPALWIAGSFSSIGGIHAKGVASWDGTTWVPRHGNSDVYRASRLAVYRNQLYLATTLNLGGSLVPRFARWAGADWEIVGVPTGSSPAAAHMTVWDDGSGAALYVTGRFAGINGVPSLNVARFDGENWSAVGGGYPTTIGTTIVAALGSTAEPLGPALYTSAAGCPPHPPHRPLHLLHPPRPLLPQLRCRHHPAHPQRRRLHLLHHRVRLRLRTPAPAATRPLRQLRPEHHTPRPQCAGLHLLHQPLRPGVPLMPAHPPSA
jgi:hypothetical protein